MVETLLVVQTIALVAILVLFITVLLVVRKELAALRDQIAVLERDVMPTVTASKELIENVNRLFLTLGRGAETAAAVVDKVKAASDAVEGLVRTVKGSVDKTAGRMSLLKLGLQTGLTTLVSYYITKRRIES